MSQGYVTIVVTTANGRQPAAGCTVTITRPDTDFRFTTQTNEDGRTEQISLESVPKEISMHYQTQKPPFIRYHAEVKCPGYLPATDKMVDIFEDVACTLQVQLVPASSRVDMPASDGKVDTTEFELVNDVNQVNLINQLKQRNQITEMYSLYNPIKVPEIIRVKIGEVHKDGPILHIPFVQYVCGVVSNLTYPTWPKEAVCLIANAVASNVLDRIQTKKYDAMGFDISDNPVIDQPFSMHRSVGVAISNVCDEVFHEYVSKWGSFAPVRFTFAEKSKDEDSMLMNPWHVMNLALQDKNALEIVQELYGKQYLLLECGQIEGAEHYPGSRQRLGSCGNDVMKMQRCINVLASQFPMIPEIHPVNGVFDYNMQEAVKVTQAFFFHEPLGVIDKKAWYAIQLLEDRISQMYELLLQIRSIHPNQLYYHGSLRLGDHAEAITTLKLMMNTNALFLYPLPFVSVNSRFDDELKHAMIQFQRLFGLPANGQVDELTWNTVVDVYQRNKAAIA